MLPTAWPLTAVSAEERVEVVGRGAPLLSCMAAAVEADAQLRPSRQSLAARIGTRAVAVWPLAPLIVTLVR